MQSEIIQCRLPQITQNEVISKEMRTFLKKYEKWLRACINGVSDDIC